MSKFDTYGLTPGHLAAYKGHVTVLEKLLHAGFYHDLQGGLGASQGPGGCTALHMAATKGHVPVIKQLLAEGANIHKEDHRGLNPLQCAAEGGHLESFNVLLEVGKHAEVFSLMCEYDLGWLQSKDIRHCWDDSAAFCGHRWQLGYCE